MEEGSKPAGRKWREGANPLAANEGREQTRCVLASAEALVGPHTLANCHHRASSSVGHGMPPILHCPRPPHSPPQLPHLPICTAPNHLMQFSNSPTFRTFDSVCPGRPCQNALS
eukprot:365703-Chlamydomonas_euryale.AAC.6